MGYTPLNNNSTGLSARPFQQVGDNSIRHETQSGRQSPSCNTLPQLAHVSGMNNAASASITYRNPCLRIALFRQTYSLFRLHSASFSRLADIRHHRSGYGVSAATGFQIVHIQLLVNIFQCLVYYTTRQILHSQRLAYFWRPHRSNITLSWT